MIRINVTENDLLAEIRTRSKRWLDLADKTRKHNKSEGKFDRKTPSWSKIKGAYITEQDGRCAYCERQLTLEETEGGNEWDVEHFRPKSSISAWPTPQIREERGIDYDLPNSKKNKKGYYLLSHNPFNYVVSCKTCNSKFKGNYFPVKNAPRPIKRDDPRLMADEEALLIYPLGDLDEDPEDLIGFRGVSPRAIGSSDDKKLRGRVTIDFFDLAGRPTLNVQRAAAITHLAIALNSRDLVAADRDMVQTAELVIDAMQNGIHPHQNCARCFVRLYDGTEKVEANKVEAKKIAARALIIFTRDSGAAS